MEGLRFSVARGCCDDVVALECSNCLPGTTPLSVTLDVSSFQYVGTNVDLTTCETPMENEVNQVIQYTQTAPCSYNSVPAWFCTFGTVSLPTVADPGNTGPNRVRLRRTLRLLQLGRAGDRVLSYRIRGDASSYTYNAGTDTWSEGFSSAILNIDERYQLNIGTNAPGDCRQEVIARLNDTFAEVGPFFDTATVRATAVS